jgi:uncharacterized protein (DUF608 family)
MTANNTGSLGDLGIGLKSLTDLVNHVVLPPRLPQCEDANPASLEKNLLHLARCVTATYTSSLDSFTQTAWKPVVTMLGDWTEIKQGSDLRNDVMVSKLASLKPAGTLICQNLMPHC